LADSLTPSDLPSPLARAAHVADERDRDDYAFDAVVYQRDRIWLHVLLLALTLVSTTLVGTSFFLSFVSDIGTRRLPPLGLMTQLIGGLWYSVPALLILGSHEMGHYLACRYYRINASLPYFIPMLILGPYGTLGAVIRIRQPFRTKRHLFDVGIAGPIAGFVVLLPIMVLGLAWSRVVRAPVRFDGFEFGEPLIVKAVSYWFFGTIPEGYMLNAHPMVFAALFGLLATAFNLMPVGQLDGGHIAYAAIGRRARVFTIGAVAIVVGLGLTITPSWLVWAALMSLLLWLTGWEHPRVPDEDAPLGTARWVLTAVAFVILVLSFIPIPLRAIDLIRR
jgi:membrane-associated protease RseP (regulator of RpoE activity)